MSFQLDAEQQRKLKEWKDKNDPHKYAGASGGRYTYHFCPTSLGVIIKVTDDLRNLEIDLSDYDSW